VARQLVDGSSAPATGYGLWRAAALVSKVPCRQYRKAFDHLRGSRAPARRGAAYNG